jgi:hypothetical protein
MSAEDELAYLNNALRALGRVIANDAFAASFQSMAQYRSALLTRVVELNKMVTPKSAEPAPPPPTVEWRCAGGCDHRCRHE